MYCTIVIFQCIRLQNLHTRKKGIECHGAGLVSFVNELFINLGIPSDHVSFLHKQYNNVDAF